MGEVTGIAWTDHTFNPWWGCTRVSPGCVHCYAEAFAKRYGTGWGPQAERRLFGDKHWNEPRKWNERAAKAGVRRRVFCASMADVFEDRPELAAERAKLFELIRETPHLDWLLLTKRPENADRLWRAALIDSFNGADSLGQVWRENVWLGVTAEDQQRADERLPLLCSIPAAVRFVSYEPALGSVDFHRIEAPDGKHASALQGHHDDNYYEFDAALDWVIVGGESGPGARPFDLAWARSIVEQCKAAGVAVFVKQLGARPCDIARAEWAYWSLQGGEERLWIDGRHVATVWDNGVWHTWDERGIGGENDNEWGDVPKAKLEAVASVARQWFHGFKLLDRKGGDWVEWPEDLRVREFPR